MCETVNLTTDPPYLTCDLPDLARQTQNFRCKTTLNKAICKQSCNFVKDWSFSSVGDEGHDHARRHHAQQYASQPAKMAAWLTAAHTERTAQHEPTPAPAPAATLELDETTTNIDLHLQKGFTLSGFVQDIYGTPLTNAIASLSMTLNGQTGELGKTQSNAKGSFLFNALSPEGDYSLDVTAGGFGSVSRWRMQFTDLQSHSLQLPPIQLKLANLQLAGTVVGPDDKPIPEVYVRIYGPDQFYGQEEMLDATNSDAGGNFLFKPVAGEPIRVAAVTGQGDQSMIGSIQVQGGDTNVLLKIHP
jgi:hypothetical protein